MKRLMVGPALAAIAAALIIPTASALGSPDAAIATKREQAQAAQAAVERLGIKLESAINRYDTARAKLAVVRDQINENEREIAIVKHNITISRATLTDQLAVAYRTGNADAVIAILSSGSLNDMLTTVDLLRRANSQLVGLVETLIEFRTTLAPREKRLSRDRRSAAALVAQAAEARREIENGIAEQKRLITGLEQEIAQLQREEAARQRRLAREAALRLAAAEAAARAADVARSDPGIGGSGGSSRSTNGGSAVPVPPPADGSTGSRAVAAAMRWLGTPYSWGGGTASGPTRGVDQGAGTVGFDCSGLTLYAYAQVGIGLDHYTGSQWNAGTRIGRIGDLVAGDLVFFGSDLGHMGMYMGSGQFIHAPHTGDVVKISALSGYYAATFRGGVRPY